MGMAWRDRLGHILDGDGVGDGADLADRPEGPEVDQRRYHPDKISPWSSSGMIADRWTLIRRYIPHAPNEMWQLFSTLPLAFVRLVPLTAFCPQSIQCLYTLPS